MCSSHRRKRISGWEVVSGTVGFQSRQSDAAQAGKFIFEMTTTSLVATAGTVLAVRITKPAKADVRVEVGEPTKAEIRDAFAAQPAAMRQMAEYLQTCNGTKLKSPAPGKASEKKKKPRPYSGTAIGFGAETTKCLRCYSSSSAAGSVYCRPCLAKYQSEAAE
jgi:hypothetical protein